VSQKSSTFIQKTRERETWLTGSREGEDTDPQAAEQSVAMASLMRGVLESIPVPEDAEERSRARALAELERLTAKHGQSAPVQAPWYLRIGHAMRYVFTLGRRR
jgi:hypothetical protein